MARGYRILKLLRRSLSGILGRKRLTLGGRVFNAVGGLPGGLWEIYRATKRYRTIRQLGVPSDTADLIAELNALAGFGARQALYKALRGKDPNRLWLL